jgi:hypothetical protein
MSEPKLNAHGSDIVRNLFEEDTNEVKTVGDIVDKHSGDSILLTTTTRGNRGADSGEAEFEEEDLLPTDPSEEWESVDDSFPGDQDEDEEGIGETDITGTAAGIARGFGSHLPLDLGADGFQIEELPDAVVNSVRVRSKGEELDDYDDDDNDNGKFDSGTLSEFEQPGSNSVARADQPDHTIPPSRFDEDIDSSYK